MPQAYGRPAHHLADDAVRRRPRVPPRHPRTRRAKGARRDRRGGGPHPGRRLVFPAGPVTPEILDTLAAFGVDESENDLKDEPSEDPEPDNGDHEPSLQSCGCANSGHDRQDLEFDPTIAPEERRNLTRPSGLAGSRPMSGVVAWPRSGDSTPSYAAAARMASRTSPSWGGHETQGREGHRARRGGGRSRPQG